MKNSKLSLVVILCLTAFSQTNSIGAAFTEWNTSDGSNHADGTLAGIGVHFLGALDLPTQIGNTGANYWTEYGHDLPYTPVTGSLPPRSDVIAMANPGQYTISFDQPVLNPVMLVMSLGNPSWTQTYNFDQPATVLSSGWGYWNQLLSNPGYIAQSGPNSVTGSEGCGVIGFNGLVSSITWTAPVYEHWQGITRALVPEPGAFALVILAFLGLSLRKRFW